MAVDDPLWPRASTWLVPDDGGAADLAVLGVPAHRTSLSATRADTTPAAVRVALARYSPATADGVDLTAIRAVDLGDRPDPDSDEEGTAEASLAAVRRGAVLVALGGDNSITHAVARGTLADGWAEAGLVTFDAHHDVRTGISNGSPVRRLIEAGLSPRRIVQIGIADFANSAAYRRQVDDWGITVVTRREVAERGMRACVVDALGIAGAAGGPVHVDVDVDVCDRSVAPGCPAGLPGGLSARELLDGVAAAASDPRVVSLDFTEVDARADAPDGRTVRLVAVGLLSVAGGVLARSRR